MIFAKWKYLILLLCLPLGGCRVGLGGLFAEVSGPSRGELINTAFPGSTKVNVDDQRKAVQRMSRRYWGMDNSALKVYAVLASDAYTASTVRSAALRAISQAERDAAVYIRHIAIALDQGDENVRLDAAVALDKVIGEAAISPLMHSAVYDKSSDVRAASAKALRHYRRATVVVPLAELLNDYDYAVRMCAHNSLVEMVGRDMGWSSADWMPPPKVFVPVKPPSPPWWDVLHLTVEDPDQPRPASGRRSGSADATSQPAATRPQDAMSK